MLNMTKGNFIKLLLVVVFASGMTGCKHWWKKGGGDPVVEVQTVEMSVSNKV